MNYLIMDHLEVIKKFLSNYIQFLEIYIQCFVKIIE